MEEDGRNEWMDQDQLEQNMDAGKRNIDRWIRDEI